MGIGRRCRFGSARYWVRCLNANGRGLRMRGLGSWCIRRCSWARGGDGGWRQEKSLLV